MTFSPGMPRPMGAGRKPGTPNRATMDAKRIAEERGCDPFEVLIMFAAGDAKGLGLKPYKDATGRRVRPYVPLDMRLDAAKAASKFLYPQRKAIEADVNNYSNPYLSMTAEELRDEMARLNSILADDDAQYGPEPVSILALPCTGSE